MQILRTNQKLADSTPYWVVRKTQTGIYYRQPFMDKKEFKRISKSCKDEIIAQGLNEEESKKIYIELQS